MTHIYRAAVLIGGLIAGSLAMGAETASAQQSITITNATYGSQTQIFDVTKDVGALCNGKANCDFTVVPKTFPSVSGTLASSRQLLRLIYYCGNNVSITEFWDDTKAQLACK